MEFHGTPWKASSLENTPWNSMKIHVLILHGIPWKIFQRIPWNSMEFHGGILHGDLSLFMWTLKKLLENALRFETDVVLNILCLADFTCVH